MTERVADIAAKTLAAHGVEHAFGMPGGEVVTLVDALEKAGVTFHLARHETAAAIMAAGAHIATGTPGLLVTTLGPGLANGINGIADASQEHVPLLVISGVVDHDIRGRYTHQIVDQKKLLAPLVKASFEIEPTGVGATVGRAISVAMAYPQGPVHIDLAPGTAATPAHGDDNARTPTPLLNPAFSQRDPSLAQLRTKLETAERPILIAGLDAWKDNAGPAVTKLAQTFNIPVITTYKGKGLLNEHDPLCLGGAGLSPLADKTLLPVVQDADLVLLVGYDPIEMRQPWCQPFGSNQDVVAIGPMMVDHGMHTANTHLVGNTSMIVEALVSGTTDIDTQQKSQWVGQDIASARQSISEAFASPKTWGPHHVFDAIEQTRPDDGIVTVDSGAHRILLSQMMRFKQPGQLLQSAGFCTMGAAIPLAAGHKAANASTPVVAVLGDGGLEMGLGELATLRDQDLPIAIVVLQDESLALIELKQKQAGLAEAGVRLGPTQFEDIAAAFGGFGTRVKSIEETKTALRDAYARKTFSIIVAEIEAQSYVGRI